MSGSDASSPRSPRDDGAARRRVGRTWPRAVVLIWIVGCAFLWGSLRNAGGPPIDGESNGLLAQEHRPRGGEPLLLLRAQAQTDPASTTEEDDDGDDAVLAAAAAVEQALGPRRVPIAPPAAEVTSWLDAHALYLLPVEAHPALQQRLTDDAITESVEGLRARLSSPLFGVAGEQARRDPLGILRMTQGQAGTLGYLDPLSNEAGAEVSAAGDLVARDGRSVLVALRTEQDPDSLHGAISEAIASHRVTAHLIGPARDTASDAQQIAERWVPLVGSLMAGLTIVLAVALRRVRPALAIVACIGSLVFVLAIPGAPGLDPLSVPLWILALGVAAEGALHLQRISVRGWPAAGVLATALLPLWISPYPLWKTWSVAWAVLIVVVMLVLRVVLPALLDLAGTDAGWSRRGFVLRPMRWLAVAVAAGLLGAGAWVTERIGYRTPDRFTLGDRDVEADRRQLVEDFFDPDRIAEVRSTGPDLPAALARSGDDARILADLIPAQIERIDSPGSFLLPAERLEARRTGLQGLELRQRMAVVEAALDSRGFRADAFGEFLGGADDLQSSPTPAAALRGPLSGWIEGYAEQHGDTVQIRSQVQLPVGAPVPVAHDADGQPIALRGPVVATQRDEQGFRDWLGIYVLCQLWIGAFVVWLGTRSFAISLSAAFAALASQSALLLAMLALRQPIGAHMLPIVLITGAVAMVAAGRSCRALDLQQPFFAMGLIVTSACQVAAGLSLVATRVPLWSQLGLLTAIGAACASGLGLFLAPGLYSLLRRVGPGSPVPKTAESDGTAAEGDDDP